MAKYKRLTKLWYSNWMLSSSAIEDGYDTYSVYPRLAQYENIGAPEDFAGLVKAKKEGRLVALPCNIGDLVYYLEGETVYEVKVTKITLFGKKGITINLCDWRYVNLDNFGKTVFLTREEAEQTLKQIRENKMCEYKNAIKDFQRFKNAGCCHSELPSSANIGLAIKALHELENSEGGGCIHCKGKVYYDVLGKDSKYNNCPMCGRYLK